jgi:hypothetical protein
MEDVGSCELPAHTLIVWETIMTSSEEMLSLEWRPIPGFPDYEVSEAGDIRRMRIGKRGHGRIGKTLKPWLYSDFGHLQLKLTSADGQKKAICVHQAVALAFHGPKPSPMHEVAHGDGVAWHNHWSNLRWATKEENRADMLLHGTAPIGEKNGAARLSDDQVREIKRLLSTGAKQKDLAKEFTVHKATIQAIAAGRNWSKIA